MKRSPLLTFCCLTALTLCSCSVSHMGPLGEVTAEMSLSAGNRTHLEELGEKAPEKEELGTVKTAPIKIEGKEEEPKTAAKQFTTARPELQTPDKEAHKAPRHGLRSSRQLMRFQAVRTTAYYHNEKDHVGYGRKTASGDRLEYGDVKSAAADWSRYPLGTRFRIVGEFEDCEYIVNDYGSALVGTNTIDLYKPTLKSMKNWGVRSVVIEVVEWGSFKKSRQIMKERTKYRHVRRMVESIDQFNLVALDAPAVRITARKESVAVGEKLESEEATQVVNVDTEKGGDENEAFVTQ